MLTSMWFMSLATLVVVDVRIRALQQKDVVLHRCHQCTAGGAGCGASGIAVVECSGARPLCATAAASPNFTAELTCAAATKRPCSLTRAANVYSLVCTCPDDLCSALFTKDIQERLLEFTSSNFTNNNASDYTEAFFKSRYVNLTEESMYKAITIETAHTTEKPVQNASHLTTVAVTSTHTTLSHSVEASLPRAEAFKHEPTALSEDDEDASEGSGAYEDTKIPRQPASDPADPSFFLPASENNAPPLEFTFLVTTPLLMYLVA